MANYKTQSIGQAKAIELADSHWWELCLPKEIVDFQLFTDELCMPFDVFHEHVETVLKRSVWTHEFAQRDLLIFEFLGERDAPTLEEICDLISAEKLIILNVGESEDGEE